MHRHEHDTRVGAYAVLDDARRILLALRNQDAVPAWTLPGGGVEPGETPKQRRRDDRTRAAAVREETGYDVELVRLLGEDTLTVAAGGRPDGVRRPLFSVRLVFEARIVGGELGHGVGDTTDEAAWIPIAEVAGLERVELVDIALRYVQR